MYYDLSKGQTIEDVIARWQSGDKLYDEDFHALFDPEDVWPYREYTWSRDSARNSPEEWDDLYASMKELGWRKNNPAIVLVGKNGRALVGEGNHRLAMAMMLGIKVPVRFQFRQEV
jgi:hypothetical protein